MGQCFFVGEKTQKVTKRALWWCERHAGMGAGGTEPGCCSPVEPATMAFSFLLCLRNNNKKKEIWQIREENKGEGEGGAGLQGATHTVR